ncbi:HAD family phosphatase [Candidatus Kaiserbacteria bacterium]|nr:HAD family phosphatase [Candidatus Kaiserbacteria bacterium]
MPPKAVVFDLDNTLAMAFTPLSERTARGLSELLEKLPIAIMSGATIERMETYVLPTLPKEAGLERLYLFPDTAAQCFVYTSGAWQRVYDYRFTKDVFEKIVETLTRGIEATGVCKDAPQWGERILARETQITFAGLGVDAPGDEKKAWDPNRKKRAILKKYLDEKLAGLPIDIRISSRTAIDITQSGVNKAEGVHWLAAHLHIEPRDMLFIGDDLDPGGNDSMVIPTGIQTRETSSPEETGEIIEQLLEALGD